MSSFTRTNCGLGCVTFEGTVGARREAVRRDQIARTKFETRRWLLKKHISGLAAKELSDNFTRSEIVKAFRCLVLPDAAPRDGDPFAKTVRGVEAILIAHPCKPPEPANLRTCEPANP